MTPDEGTIAADGKRTRGRSQKTNTLVRPNQHQTTLDTWSPIFVIFDIKNRRVHQAKTNNNNSHNIDLTPY